MLTYTKLSKPLPLQQNVDLSYFTLRSTAPKQLFQKLQKLQQWKISSQNSVKYDLKEENNFQDGILTIFKLRSPQDFKQILENIQNYDCQQYQLSNFRLNFATISRVNFFNLKKLSIENCALASIEGLAWLNIGLIKSLTINISQITYLKPLSKIHCKELQYVALKNNKFNIHEIVHANRMLMKNNIKAFHFYDFIKNKEIDREMDMRSIFKLGIKTASYLPRQIVFKNEKLQKKHEERFRQAKS